MSDGPYKSLPMRKPWRTVTEYAHKDSFTPDECASAMRSALHHDFSRDVPQDMLKAVASVLLENEQGNLLPNLAHQELENIRYRFPSSALGDAVIEDTQAALQMGKTGEAAWAEGLTRAALNHADGSIRAVEEHYRSEPQKFQSEQKTVNVRERLAETLRTEVVKGVGQEVVAMHKGEKINTKLSKEDGLDSGPVIV